MPVTGSPSSAYDESATWTGVDVPTNKISWYEALQFINWLNTDSGHAPAYNFTVNQGTSDYAFSAWESGDDGYDVNNPYRNSGAFYFMPTNAEWHKAAYWNGTNLQTYATKPGDTLYQGNGSNGGWNYKEDDDPGESPWDVGSGSEELNGTFDMMGNVWEWVESTSHNGSNRLICGGCYDSNDYSLGSTLANYTLPSNEYDRLGFRVASVPEPCSLVLLSLGGLVSMRKRRA